MHRLNGRPLKPIHDWVKSFAQTWNERFDVMEELLDELKRKEKGDVGKGK
jgi:hypothetical protein